MFDQKLTGLRNMLALIAAVFMLGTLAACGGNKDTASQPESGTSDTGPAPTDTGDGATGATDGTQPGESGSETTKSQQKGDTTAKATTGKTAATTKKADGPVSDDGVWNDPNYTFIIGSGFFGDTEDPMVKEMREAITKKFGCKTKINFFWPSLESMQKKTAAGDKVADIMDMPANLMYQSAMAGYLQPLNSVKGVNVDDARWIKGATKLATMNGKTWGVSFWYPPGVRACVFYNKNLLKSNGVNDDMNQLVKNGGWTFAKFREIAKATTKVSNTAADTYGFGFADPNYAVFNFMAANGGGLARAQGGKVAETFSDANSLEALNFYNQLINEDKVAKVSANLRKKDGGDSDVDMDEMFVNGKLALYVAESWKAVQAIKPKADRLDYGILPLPKGPKASDYVSSAENYSPLFCITSTNTKDVTRSVQVLNYLGKYFADSFKNESWKDDVAKEYFKTGDKASLDMYTYILDRSVIDPGYMVDNLRTNFTDNVIRKALYQQDGTPAQAVQAQKGRYTKDIDAVFNK